MADREHPPAGAHGELRALFDDVFFVSGTVKMAPVAFSRNMTVVRDGESLTLINTMRLNERGLAALDALGKVEHVVRIAGFHGMDDPFYKERYGAKVWVMRGQIYAKGFANTKPNPQTYFTPDAELGDGDELPIEGGRAVLIDGACPEGLVHLARHGGIIVSGDCFQNWYETDAYFNLLGKVSMKLMGFIKPHNIGPGWLKEAKPDLARLERVMSELDFEHVLPVHGREVIGDAKAKYRPAVERVRG